MWKRLSVLYINTSYVTLQLIRALQLSVALSNSILLTSMESKNVFVGCCYYTDPCRSVPKITLRANKWWMKSCSWDVQVTSAFFLKGWMNVCSFVLNFTWSFLFRRWMFGLWGSLSTVSSSGRWVHTSSLCFCSIFLSSFIFLRAQSCFLRPSLLLQ